MVEPIRSWEALSPAQQAKTRRGLMDLMLWLDAEQQADGRWHYAYHLLTTLRQVSARETHDDA